MYSFPYLTDSVFLKEFDKLKVKQQFVKIVVLSFDEVPIQSIEGRVQSGSINVDGSSAMRRTGSLTLITSDKQNDLTKLRNLLSINKKIQILVGFANTTDKYTNYRMIWFPQGVFVITAANLSHSTSGITISLTIHDKMALLNGECGGTLPTSVVFHEIEDIDENGNTIINRPTIYQIIQELVHHFGGEQIGKIIISDIDERVKRIMKWTGSTPLFLLTTIDGSGNEIYEFSTDYDELVSRGIGDITEFDYGADVGYIMDDFYYPTDLIGNAGDSVVTILDNIKNTLGNFEYFYDINGNFIFQEIKNYLNKSYGSTIVTSINSDDYLTDYVKGKSVYTFDNSDIVTSYSNAPQYQQIKNDFVVWGSKPSMNDSNKYPIRYHLAIDEKPAVGNTYKVFFFTDEDGILKAKKPVQFLNKGAFPLQGEAGIFYLAADTNIIYKWNYQTKTYDQTEYELQQIVTQDFRSELYLNGVQNEPFGTESNYYYTELQNEWTKIYDLQNGGFRQQIVKNPEQMEFFLDFIDSPDMEFSIKNIGRRTSTIVDDTINCVFAPQYPDIVMIEAGTDQTEERRRQCESRNQRYSQVDGNIYKMLINGGTYKSAFDQIKKELYQYTSFNNQVTLTVLPIYYLQPNSRITIQNDVIGIYGDYMIKSLNIPLDVNSTMNITCTKALERI